MKYLSLSNLSRGALLAAIIAFGYFVPNFFVLFPTHSVVLTRFDHWVPLQPVWIWIYICYYPLMISAWFITTDTIAQRIFFGAMSLAAFVGFIVFFFFPTMISRELYPWNGPMDLSAMMLAHIRGADEPVNCLPSMHVCMSFISATCISLVVGRSGRMFAWTLFLAICYSTMATKQHYFVDLVAGFCLGVTCVAMFMYRNHVLPHLPDLISEKSYFKHAAVSRTSLRPSRLRAVVSKLRRRA